MSGAQPSNFSQISDRLIPVKQYVTPVTGDTVTINNTGRTILFINPAGTLATLTVAFPGVGTDQDTILITTSKAITSLTLSGATIVGALTSMAIGDNAEYTYFSDSLTWAKTG